MAEPVFKTNLWKLLGERQAETGERLTVSELSDLVGLSRQTLYRYGNEDGTPTISADAIAALCSFFDCTYNEFVYLDAPPLYKAQETERKGELVPA